MPWFKQTPRGGTCALFGAIPPAPAGTSPASLDNVRELMLACIADADTDRHPSLARRIRCAADVESLWFLRGDLMALLAGRWGEAAALATLDDISNSFENLLPAGLRSRPSLLHRQPRR